MNNEEKNVSPITTYGGWAVILLLGLVAYQKYITKNNPRLAAKQPARQQRTTDAAALSSDAKKKAEKAARREQAKAVEPAPAPVPTPAAGNDKQGGGKQNKSKQDAPGTPAANRSKKPAPAPAPVAPKQPPGPVVPESFSHLPMARKLPLSKPTRTFIPLSWQSASRWPRWPWARRSSQ